MDKTQQAAEAAQSQGRGMWLNPPHPNEPFYCCQNLTILSLCYAGRAVHSIVSRKDNTFIVLALVLSEAMHCIGGLY